MKAITLKQAIKIANCRGTDLTHGDGTTFYATNDQETEIYEFDSKIERDRRCERQK